MKITIDFGGSGVAFRSYFRDGDGVLSGMFGLL